MFDLGYLSCLWFPPFLVSRSYSTLRSWVSNLRSSPCVRPSGNISALGVQRPGREFLWTRYRWLSRFPHPPNHLLCVLERVKTDFLCLRFL